MDSPLRTKLLTWFIAVALVEGALTVLAGTVLISRAVDGEARRRVEVGRAAARVMLDRRLQEARKAAAVIAGVAAKSPDADVHALLAGLSEQSGFDYVQFTDGAGVLRDAAAGAAGGRSLLGNALVAAAIREGREGATITLVPLDELVADGPELASRARVTVTAEGGGGGPRQLQDALVLEGVAPVRDRFGRVSGVARVGVLLTRNSAFVDLIRESVFSFATYKGKNLGVVTVTQGDVRIATNVGGAGGGRAVGTPVSEEVSRRVLGEGKVWTGVSSVLGNSYFTGYEPLRTGGGKVVGMLAVGVLKDRYDDIRQEVMNVFVGIAALALLMAFGVATWRAGKIARPLSDLTEGVVAVAGGDLGYQLPKPQVGRKDEVRRLTTAFLEMVDALNRRDAELRASNEQIARAADELRRWNESYQEALAFITHELKNQVAAMKINLLAMRDGYVGELSEDQQEAVGDVADAIARTEDMIGNYLNLSRLERGDLDVRARPLQIELEAVQPVLKDLRLRFEEKRMQVEVDLPEELVVQADPTLLQIVFANLLSNAAKYGRQGGRVRVWGRRTNGWVELHVWNEGEGIPVDQRESLFQKFSRLHNPGTYERGTGLGLFITREIVLKLGGRIWAESEHGQWADFVVALPRPDVVIGEDVAVDS